MAGYRGSGGISSKNNSQRRSGETVAALASGLFGVPC